jgi:C_GCAxxG_C_C family probable redox protein
MPQNERKETLLDRIEKDAHEYEKNFHGCSRCVLKPLQEHLGVGDDQSLRASTPMAAGVAMRGETCGALLGGLMAVGMATASQDMSDTDALRNSLAAGFRLAKRVEKEFGTTNCTKLQTDRLGRYYSLADPEQYQAFIKAGGYAECSKVCGRIARMTAEFILEYQDKENR